MIVVVAEVVVAVSKTVVIVEAIAVMEIVAETAVVVHLKGAASTTTAAVLRSTTGKISAAEAAASSATMTAEDVRTLVGVTAVVAEIATATKAIVAVLEDVETDHRHPSRSLRNCPLRRQPIVQSSN